MERSTRIDAFLQAHQWGDASRQDFAADFSPRRYARLTLGERSAILMDADADQKTPEFVALSGLLDSCDISAPRIYAADSASGLVLMEDLGNRNMGALVDGGGDLHAYATRAVAVLAHLHRVFKPNNVAASLPVFNAELLTRQVELFVDAYIPHALRRPATQGERDDFIAAWRMVLRDITAGPQTLMLRDYMLDNLMDLPDRADWRSVGVLDFQDAGIGPVAYDIASLCERVRRDPHETLLKDMIACYVSAAASPLSVNQLLHDCHILSAQRHMRIMGIIAQLVVKGRSDKLAYLPRVKNYLRQLLHDDRLAPLQSWIKSCKIDMS